MKASRLATIFALALLLAAFGTSAWRLISRGAAEIDPNVEVIRFAHWQLEPGVREAFDAIAAEYMARHPHVRVDQIPIPGRVWRQWLNTQLVGGMAPDLIALATYNNPDDMLARYFTPLSAWLEEPNPYNADEPDLADLPWRRTYSAELVPVEGVHYHSTNLLEYFGVPNAMVTVRVFYNRDLMREIVGDVPPPRTFREFADLCETIARFSTERRRPLLPLAGSVFNITRFTDGLFHSATQRFAMELDHNLDLNHTQLESLKALVRREWDLASPPIRQSLRLVEELGRHMPAGWMQLDREDSMMQFAQGRAVMIATGTWDAGGLMLESPFAVGAFPMPEIGADDPEFGEWSLGPVSEANIFASLSLGLTRTSRHPERAIDFLRFLTSRRGNQMFSEISTWLPVIKGVAVPEVSEPFRPVVDGYPFGVNLRALGGRAHDLFVQHLHLLSGQQADVDVFVATVNAPLLRSGREELARYTRTTHENIRQNDSALLGRGVPTPPEERAHSRFDRLAALQLTLEARRQEALHTLRTAPPAP
jgi:raffinose/stachyose/melibiose transport system substrate-binding protein